MIQINSVYRKFNVFFVIPLLVMILYVFLSLSSARGVLAKHSIENDEVGALKNIHKEIKIQAPCGILENFEGEVQVLDETKKNVKDGNIKLPLVCGSWITVNKGWAKIRHQNGSVLHLSENTFVKLIDFRKDSEFKGDHLLLFKGQVFAYANNTEEEFRMVTAGGRARLIHGKSIFIYDQTQEETQLIALEHSSSLENRFEPSRKVKVQQGESTSFNLQLLRVLPHPPVAISVAKIRPLLSSLRISDKDQFYFIRIVTKRNNRTFASQLDSEDLSQKTKLKTGAQKRELASQNQAKSQRIPASQSYLRHQPSAVDGAIHDHWIKKMVGGEKIGEKILFPDKFYGKSQQIHIHVENLFSQMDEQISLFNPEEVKEKKKLLEELSKIRVD